MQGPLLALILDQRNHSQSTGPELLNGWHSDTFKHLKSHHIITFYNVHCEIKTESLSQQRFFKLLTSERLSRARAEEDNHWSTEDWLMGWRKPPEHSGPEWRTTTGPLSTG